jgi:stalled ribosome alternative rescue factor ArfA
MSEFKNIFIFVSDALAYSHLPEKIAEGSESGAIKTLAPSLHSPQSFSSLVTGLESSNHNVGNFGQILENDSIFDYFQNSELYDEEMSAVRQVLNLHGKPKELTNMEEPFIWIERAMETHEPYAIMSHGNKLPDEYSYGSGYYNDKTKGEIRENYQKALENVEEHFWNHVQELKDKGIYEDTLIIFTSDHGEVLGDRIWFRQRYGHNSPPTHHIGQVPTVFLNANPDVDYMRTVDILPTSLDYIGKKWMMETDGLSVLEDQKDEGYCLTPMRLFNLRWEWDGEKWTPKNKIKAFIEDKLYRRPSKRLLDRIHPERELR